MIVKECFEIEKEVQVPVLTTEVQDVERCVEVPKYLYQDFTKVIEVPNYIPVIHEKPTFEIIEKKIPYIVRQPEIRYLDKK